MCKLNSAQDSYKNAVKRNEVSASTPTFLAPPGQSNGPSNNTTPTPGESLRSSPETPTNTTPVPNHESPTLSLGEGTSAGTAMASSAAAPPRTLPGISEHSSALSSTASLTAAPVSPPVRLVDVHSSVSGVTRGRLPGAVGLRSSDSLKSIDTASITTTEGSSSSSGSDTPIQLLPPPPSKSDIQGTPRRGGTAQLVRAHTHTTLPAPWGTPPTTPLLTGAATGNTAMLPASGGGGLSNSCSSMHQKLRKTLSGGGSSSRRPLFRKDIKTPPSLSPPAQRKGRLGTLKALHDKAKSMDVMFV